MAAAPRRPLVAVAVAASLAPAAPAAALEASVERGSRNGVPASIATVRADPGEANRLSARTVGSTLVVRDEAATVRAGAGCTVRSEHELECALVEHGREVQVELGDGDDAADLDATASERGAHVAASVDGGAGDDAIVARSSAHLAGGDGDDALTAAPAGSSLDGGPGRDRLTGGPGGDGFHGGPGDDAIDGGPGGDELSIGDPGGAAVDLAAGTAEYANGERDAIAGIEDVDGSDGPDRIAGDDGPNTIWGMHGEDAIDGRGGDDFISGTEDRDVIRGGAGDDHIEGVDGDRADGGPGDDTLALFGSLLFTLPDAAIRNTCGPGEDTVQVTGGLIAADCERISIDLGHFRTSPHPVAVSPRALTFEIACRPPRLVELRRCVRQLELAARSPDGDPARARTVARRRFATRRGRTARVRLPLSPAAARALRHRTAMVTLRGHALWEESDDRDPLANALRWGIRLPRRQLERR